MGSLSLYPVVEDANECSGMCQPGLFYFGKSIEQSRPTETCYRHFKKILSEPASFLGGMAIFTSCLSIVLVLLQVILMGRPADPYNNLSGQFPARAEDYAEIELPNSVAESPRPMSSSEQKSN
jgi:hypothetical protein